MIDSKTQLEELADTGVKTPSIRESNIELFRIITMLLIVAHHYVVNSGLTAANGPIQADPLSGRSIFLLLFGAWGKTGINCFVMITGYFMCKSQITAKKFAKLFCEIMFYQIIFYLVFLLSGYEPFSLKTLAKALIPVTQINADFKNCFLLFWLFIPFLNILINNLNERQHIKLILLSSFLYVVLGTLHQVTMNYVSWFVVLYFIASYLRFYPKKCFDSTRMWGILAFCSVLISVISVVACTWLGTKIHDRMYYAFVSDSNTFLAVSTGTFAFLFFKNIKMKYNKFINTVAASTFGVVLIHANSNAMREWLWKDTLDNVGYYNSSLMPIHAIGSVICIFTVCVIIDIVRIKFLEKPFFAFWDKHWDGVAIKYKNWEDKVFKKLSVK